MSTALQAPSVRGGEAWDGRGWSLLKIHFCSLGETPGCSQGFFLALLSGISPSVAQGIWVSRDQAWIYHVHGKCSIAAASYLYHQNKKRKALTYTSVQSQSFVLPHKTPKKSPRQILNSSEHQPWDAGETIIHTLTHCLWGLEQTSQHLWACSLTHLFNRFIHQ